MPDSPPEPAEDERIQMYNLGGEYPDLPTRLLAWPDFCTQVARAESAEAELRRIKDEANRVVEGACLRSWSDDIRARESAESRLVAADTRIARAEEERDEAKRIADLRAEDWKVAANWQARSRALEDALRETRHAGQRFYKAVWAYFHHRDITELRVASQEAETAFLKALDDAARALCGGDSEQPTAHTSLDSEA